jgi:hypothetical protein
MRFCSASEIQQSRQDETSHYSDASDVEKPLRAVRARVCAGSVGPEKVACAGRKEQSESGLMAISIEEDIECTVDMRRRYYPLARLQRFLSGFLAAALSTQRRASLSRCRCLCSSKLVSHKIFSGSCRPRAWSKNCRNDINISCHFEAIAHAEQAVYFLVAAQCYQVPVIPEKSVFCANASGPKAATASLQIRPTRILVQGI